ncbi:MAG: ribosomal protein S18-alanine N-acetyltransferase [Chromatiales bacterium]|nr:ribosomal protein S18-alanine N-acetyltransferase [Chromatiales bacterium]
MNRSAPDRGLVSALNFQPMRLEDVDRVMAIERHAYEFPWTEGIFRDCIRAGYYCCVLVREDALLGYGVMAVAVEEAHALNLCIDPQAQGQGYGRALLDHLMRKARLAGAARMLLEVRVSNFIAQALYASVGFIEIGVRRNYYPDRGGREDAIVLSRMMV